MKLYKYFFISILFVFGLQYLNAQNLSDERTAYESCRTGNVNSINSFFNKMSSTNISNSPVLAAYKGASLLLKGKIEKGVANKKKYAKEGIILIENAVKAETSNIEIRLIRLSIQENVPKILKYNTKIQEDKSFIVKNYANQNDALKKYIQRFVSQSKSFTEKERTTLK